MTSPVGRIKRKEATTSIAVVTQKTLRQTSSTNIIDAVAKQPGVAQITTGSGISKPVIRGLSNNRIVTVADGIRQEGQQWGGEHGIELDGSAVGDVEILKGPASLMYGSDALAGVVIFHPEPIEPEGQINVSIASEYQSNSGLFDYSLRFGGNKQGIVWNGRYSEKFAHAYKNRFDGYVPGMQFHERAASGLVGLNKGWGFSHLTLSYYHLTPSMTEGERDPMTGELTTLSDKRCTYSKVLPYQQIHHYKAVLDNSFSIGNGLLKAIIGYQQNRRQEFESEEHDHEHDHDHASDPSEPDDFHIGSSNTPSLDFLLHTLTYDVRYSFFGFEGWKLTGGIGGMFQRSLNEGEEYLIPAYRLFDLGAYLTASKTLRQWTLSGGLRYDTRHLHSFQLIEDENIRFTDFRRNFDALSASLGAVYRAGQHVNIRANIARGFRAPNLSELGSNGVHHGTLHYEVGNPDLRPEHSWQGDLGLDFSSRYLSAELALFLNRIENYIFAEAAPDATESDEYTTFRYTQGDALLKGFETSIDIHPIHQLHLGTAFGIVDARQLHQPRETRYLPLTPAPRINAEVKWEFTHNGDHHTNAPHHRHESIQHHRLDHIFDNAYVSIGLEHNFRQNHYYRADNTETDTPAYTLFNLSAGTDILLPKGRKLCELYFFANNLLDKAYQSHLSRLKYADTNVLTGRQGIYNPGRNFTVKIIVPLTFAN